MGYFTKFGDCPGDATPLTGLTKRRVRAIASYLGVPAEIIRRVPTADLESLVPQRPDEDVFGVTYDEIDDFLEGRVISEHAARTILGSYESTAHKRALPPHP